MTITAFITYLSFSISVVLPNDPYIYIGDNLSLTCNLTVYKAGYDSKYLTFSHKDDKPISASLITILTTRSIVLHYPITSPDDAGNYICKLNHTDARPEIIGEQFVRVECKCFNW